MTPAGCSVLDLMIIAALAKLSKRGRWLSASAIVIGVVIWIGAGAALVLASIFISGISAMPIRCPA
jgi:hypothetical protein